MGAGAAGLAASIFAAETAGPAAHIVLLDGARQIGAKILISGGGRCNVTHDVVRDADFTGSKRAVRTVLAAFDERATVRWFASLGVALKREESGKLFPTTDKARTVLDALLDRCDALGVELRTRHRVTRVAGARPAEGATDAAAANGGFAIEHEQGELLARQMILATGGRSLPRTGSDGAGWEIVRGLGHTVTTTHAALVPLLLDETAFHAELSGLSHPAELSTFAAGRLADRRTGNLLWTHFGISGPVVMDASRHWLSARDTAPAGQAVELRCSFLPGRDFAQVERSLIDRGVAQPRLSVAKAVTAELPARLATALVQRAGIDAALPLGQITRPQRRALVHALTGMLLPVLRDRGWNYAEVTAGGVPLNEISPRTMESRCTPGLYLVGEMLDCDGRIGGFNFQWAWATGYLAGRAAGETTAV